MRSTTEYGGYSRTPQLPGSQLTEYDERAFRRFLGEFGIEHLFLIHNHYWPNNFEKLQELIQEGGFVSLLRKNEYKGLTIHKYRVGYTQRQE